MTCLKVSDRPTAQLVCNIISPPTTTPASTCDLEMELNAERQRNAILTLKLQQCNTSSASKLVGRGTPRSRSLF